ncbi:Grx4 family monothiol glutaredoxin [Buchnera aphidicola (Taiwanaphis decaspermi)]|uniref:Grx4 family monothiol glutaredoxin n=1 Tax=Buchnera aphidicola TaxID=9 RepID=UPI0031B88389
MKTIEKIKKQIKENKIIIYMKGTPSEPSCGYSAQAVEALNHCTKKFFYVNVLKDSKIRRKLPIYANWPTFPQLWVNGKLIGGCSIILDMLNNGKLFKLIKNIS